MIRRPPSSTRTDTLFPYTTLVRSTARYVDQLVDRLLDPVAFGPHVADIHAAAFRGLARQRDEFVGFGIGAGGIDDRAADAHRTLVHRLPHQRPHPAELFGGRIAIAFAQLVDAHRSSEERRVGKACVSPCRYRWSPYQ